MQSRRIVIGLMLTGGLCGLCLLTGCGDDSKTSGSQVQMSPEVKAEINDMRSAQKEALAERKAAAAQKRKKR